MTLALALNLSIEFIGPCSIKPLLKSQITQEAAQSVGAASIATLDQNEVSYQGNEAGLNSAFDTPIGLDAIEVISESEMRSYGWCFEIDGMIPEVYSNQFPLTDVKSEIKWFFGYAHYLNGQWVSQCEPAYKIKPAFLCKDLIVEAR